MKRFQIRSRLLPALSFVLVAGSTAAQDRSPALLNTLEVQQLVKRAEPGGGTGALTPTVQELNALAAKASTPADHHSLEAYFLTLAKRYTADATEHAATANTYRGTKIAQAAVHCDSLVRLSKAAAKEATDAASMHKQLASVAR